MKKTKKSGMNVYDLSFLHLLHLLSLPSKQKWSTILLRSLHRFVHTDYLLKSDTKNDLSPFQPLLWFSENGGD
jgi:hypothetical protein